VGVYDLVSRFGLEAALKETEAKLYEMVNNEIYRSIESSNYL
jgi:hypothetical protein